MLQSRTRRHHPPEPHGVVSWAFKPEVEVLCADRRALEDGGAEPDDEVTDSALDGGVKHSAPRK
jgi:hypothetical protein